MHPRLRRERQHVDPVVSERLAVARDACRRRTVKTWSNSLAVSMKTVEVRRVLLVPEDRGDALLAAPGDQVAQLLLGRVRAAVIW